MDEEKKEQEEKAVKPEVVEGQKADKNHDKGADGVDGDNAVGQTRTAHGADQAQSN